ILVAGIPITRYFRRSFSKDLPMKYGRMIAVLLLVTTTMLIGLAAEPDPTPTIKGRHPFDLHFTQYITAAGKSGIYEGTAAGKSGIYEGMDPSTNLYTFSLTGPALAEIRTLGKRTFIESISIKTEGQDNPMPSLPPGT